MVADVTELTCTQDGMNAVISNFGGGTIVIEDFVGLAESDVELIA